MPACHVTWIRGLKSTVPCSRILSNGRKPPSLDQRTLHKVLLGLDHASALAPSFQTDVQILKVQSSAHAVKALMVMIFKGFFNREDQSRVGTKYCSWLTKLAWSGS